MGTHTWLIFEVKQLRRFSVSSTDYPLPKCWKMMIKGAALLLAGAVLVQMVDTTKTNADKCAYPKLGSNGRKEPCLSSEGPYIVEGFYYNPSKQVCGRGPEYDCKMEVESKPPGFDTWEDCQKECVDGNLENQNY